MRFKGFVGQSYNLRNTQYDCQRTINWFPEANESGLGKEGEVAQLAPTPGLYPVLQNLAGSSRGGYIASNNQMYYVFGNTLYNIGGSSLDTFSASILYKNISGANRCQFTDNGVDMFIIGDGHGYRFNFATQETTSINEPGWSAASSLTYFDTYVLFTKNNSNQFFWTDPLSTDIPALNFASAEANPDRIVGIINNNQDLWVFGKRTVEFWYNYGQANTPFARRPSQLIETGCASALTIKKLNNTLFWLSEDDRGGPMLIMANGYTPQRVSTYPIEQEWLRSSREFLSQASAYAYQQGGHFFYALNIPGQSSTWVYDMTVSAQLGSPVWHERQSRQANGTQGRYYANDAVYYRGFTVMGDYRKGTLYVADENTYTDDNQPVLRERTTPHVSNSMNRIYYSNMTLDVAQGTSTDSTIDPLILMQFSNDGGKTWSEERWVSAGKMGKYGGKIQFYRLGSGRNRVFRIRVTDPVYWAISGADIDIKAGDQ